MGLAYKSATGDTPFLVQNECDSSPFNHQSFLSMIISREQQTLFEIYIVLPFCTTCSFKIEAL